MGDLKPAHPAIVLEESDAPFVRGYRCHACDAKMIEHRLACPNCGETESLEAYRVCETGKLHSFSIVHRSYPGVETPFISAIVDMDDGTTLKGNLRGVSPDPSEALFNLPVRLSFADAGRRDKEGGAYISYFFDPAQKEAMQ